MKGLIRRDVAVIGAGPAGIAAACLCAERGLSVIMLDPSFRVGGQIWRDGNREKLPAVARSWIARLESSSVSVVTGSSVVGTGAAGSLIVASADGVTHVAARSTVIATGARELLLPFPGWTLPGVVGAGGAQALLKEGASFRGRRVVVAGSGPLLLPVAAALATAGARVAHVLEQAGPVRLAHFASALIGEPAQLLRAAAFAASFRVDRYRSNAWIERAIGADHIDGVVIRSARGKRREVPCDLLCSGFGLIPSVELARALGCEIAQGSVVASSSQQTSKPGIYAAGEVCGVAGVENAVAQGSAAAYSIVGEPAPIQVRRQQARGRRMQSLISASFQVRREVLDLPDGDTILCRCEDVRQRELSAEWGWRETRLLTRMGMGSCQGRICGAAMQLRYGVQPGDARMPVFPVPVGALADQEPSGLRE
jgi:NADPH-dependent 2,4-dienoyl-CoA reductase/sulfur reductase-like enzyme